MSVTQFLGTKDCWEVSVQDDSSYLVSGNETSNKDKKLNEKHSQLKDCVKNWRENLREELEERKKDVSEMR